jgi:hypothetical protein
MEVWNLMGVVSNGDVLRVACRTNLESAQDCVNVYHFEAQFFSDQDDSDVLAAIVDKMQTAYSALNPNISNLVDVIDIKVDVVEFIGGVLKIVRAVGLVPWSGGAFSPTAAGEALPPGVAGLVKFLTGIGKVYGRKFIGGIVEASQAGGVLGSGFLTQLGTYAAALMVPIEVISGANLLQLGVMSSKLATFVPFLSVDVTDIVAYQRRRRPGSGS